MIKKNIITKTIITTLFILISLNTLLGQSLMFLNIPQEPRAMSMGGASVALDASAYAINNNLASISFAEHTAAVGINYATWQPNLTSNNLIGIAGYFKINKKIGLAINGRYFDHASYEISDEDGMLKGQFTPKEYTLDMGLSYLIMDRLSMGVTLRYLGSILTDKDLFDDYKNGYAFAADISLMYKLDKLTFAAAATNLGTKIRYGYTDQHSSYNLPSMIKFGAAYDYNLTEQHKLTASAEFDYLIKQKEFTPAVGLEYTFNDMMSLRGGYNHGDSNEHISSYTSVGVGGNFMDISLNAAYIVNSTSSTLNNTFNFSLEVNF